MEMSPPLNSFPFACFKRASLSPNPSSIPPPGEVTQVLSPDTLMGVPFSAGDGMTLPHSTGNTFLQQGSDQVCISGSLYKQCNIGIIMILTQNKNNIVCI